MRSLPTALAGALVILLMTACGPGADRDVAVPPDGAPPTGASQAALTAGSWRIAVAVRPSRLGPIVFAARDLARLKPTSSVPWLQHDVVIRNTGDQLVTFADTRTSKFIGESGHHRLLVADEGCGYSLTHPQAPARAGACRSYLDLLRVKPHASAERTITLFKALPGMDRLVAGTYVFRQPIRFQAAGRQPGGGGRAGVVTVVYEIASGPG
jgi:hypothetical protein